MIEILCIHQFYPFYHDNGKYGGHYCLHCGKWKTLPNQVNFHVREFDKKLPPMLLGIKALQHMNEAFRSVEKSKICTKCGRENLIVQQAVIGFPDHHIADTRQEYCGFCDEPPMVELSTEYVGGFTLLPNS